MHPAQMRQASAPTSRSKAARALRVYVVEQDRGVARELAGVFEARGLVARVVGEGRAALDLVEASPPDLIVLSAELGDISGYAVCSQLKRDRALASIPVIMTTAQAEGGGVEAHRRLWVRADAYLRKPFDVSALLQMAAMLVDLPPGPAVAPASADAEVLEDGFVYLGGAGEPQVLDDELVRVVVQPERAVVNCEEVLEDGFVYVAGGSEAVDEDVTVRVLDSQRLLDHAARTAPGRWKLPEGMGVSAR